MSILNKLYVNGCSHTAGGGLDSQDIKNRYQKIYDVTWVNEKDITYPKYVADYFNIGIYNDAQSGSGAPRLIRTTWEYILKHSIEDIQKTLFLLQINNPINRVEYYCNKINDYLIINCHYNNDLTLREFNVTHRWSETDKIYGKDFFEGEIKNDIRNFIKKYHDPSVYLKSFVGQLIGLFSFFKIYNIQFFYILDCHSIMDNASFYNLEDVKKRKIEIDGFYSINPFTLYHNKTIKKELDGFTDDEHPGYFGHKLYGEKLSIEIEKKIKIL
jgi:hypothetical protein